MKPDDWQIVLIWSLIMVAGVCILASLAIAGIEYLRGV